MALLTIQRILTILLTMTTFITLGASPALAAPPSNDSFAGRTIIAALPFTASIDTSQATTDPTDPATCGGASDLATVWYAFTPPVDMRLLATTTGSSYLAGVNVYTGDPTMPGSLTRLDCGLEGVGIDARAGTTYFFLVSACCDGTVGGDLVFTLKEFRIQSALTLEPTGTIYARTGAVTILGSVTCTEPALVSFELRLEQRVGQRLIQSFSPSADAITCDQQPQRLWFGPIVAENRRFIPGTATFTVTTIVCDPLVIVCDRTTVAKTVNLRMVHEPV